MNIMYNVQSETVQIAHMQACKGCYGWYGCSVVLNELLAAKLWKAPMVVVRGERIIR